MVILDICDNNAWVTLEALTVLVLRNNGIDSDVLGCLGDLASGLLMGSEGFV